MSINRVNYNPYLNMDSKKINNSYGSKLTTNPFLFSADTNNINNVENTDNVDLLELVETNQNQDNDNVNDKNKDNLSVSELRKELEETKSKQGLIGKLWDGFKNLTGIGAGSSKAEKAIEDFENGKISQEEMEKAVNGYKKGQDMALDIVADMASGLISIAAFALAVPTGGLSLAVGLGISTAVGAGVKAGIKGIDALVHKKEYSGKDFLYDVVTGGVNGLFGPITNGIGNSVTKTIGTKMLGMTVTEGGKEVGKQVAKNSLKSIILTQTVDVAGGTLGKRALALGAGMAVDGAISGAADNMARAALNGEDIVEAGIQGAAGGLIMAPIIGGGMRVVSKGASKIGNTIKEGVENGKKAFMCDFPPVDDDMASMFTLNNENLNTFIKTLTSDDTEKFLSRLRANKSFDEAGFMKKLVSSIDASDLTPDEILTARSVINGSSNLSELFQKIGDNELFVKIINSMEPQDIQCLIESGGVGTTKIAQILSNKESFMEKIEDYPAIQEAFRRTRSDCQWTRSVEEAEAYFRELFPQIEIKEFKRLSPASIGETYRIKTTDNKYHIVKMLKEGITEESLDEERDIMKRFITSFSNGTEEETQSLLRQVDQLYKDWAGELDFSQEYQSNIRLKNNAKRYKVAQITDISSDNKCVIMDMASGIQMNKLKDMLDEYRIEPQKYRDAIDLFKNNPDLYNETVDYYDLIKTAIKDGNTELAEELQTKSPLAAKYVSEKTLGSFAVALRDNPWLADPEKVIKDLPTTWMKAFDEQLLFIKDGGTSFMHGDAHTGNFFITTDAKGNLIPEFIDTGLCVTRNSSQICSLMNFCMSYFTGNPDGTAEYFISLCKGIPEDQKTRLTKELSQYIQDEIFASGNNITKAGIIMDKIQSKLKELNIEIDAESTTVIKAQAQFFDVAQELASLSNKPLDIVTIIKDLPKATILLLKNGASIKDIAKVLKVALEGMKQKPTQAISSITQFVSQPKFDLNA